MPVSLEDAFGQALHGDSNATDEKEGGEDVDNDEVSIGRSGGARSRSSSSRSYGSTIPATVLPLGTDSTNVSHVWPTLVQVQYFRSKACVRWDL